MDFINSALRQRTSLVHLIAGLVIVVILPLLIFEMRGFFRSKKPAKRVTQAKSAAPNDIESAGREATQPLEIGMPREPEDRDSSPVVPQVFLLCQDDVEPDEATFPYARILVSARGDSDAGKKRPGNEDSFLLLPEHSLFAVADGMGGYHGGKTASSLAVDTLRTAFDQTAFDDEFLSDAPIPRRGRELATALVKANRAVFSAAQATPELNEMGTTLVAARFSPDKRRVYVGHVGDSRCYRLRGSTLTQITTDHTMRHLGMDGPHANDLFRAVGIDPNVIIDLVVDMPQPEDIYLLCSDGLSKMVSDEQIGEALRGEADLEAAVYRLIELANDAGGRDNITVILVRVREQLALEAELSDSSPESPAVEDNRLDANEIHVPVTGAERGSAR
ncbi:MAG TPA: protein phosphatase 2C domain-containing protein [Polyangiaceae bacterium]|jgi:protein phosphatase